MKVSGDKKRTWVCLGTGPLFFHVFPKLVQALLVTYDIFQAPAAEDVLLPKPFLDPTHTPCSPDLAPFDFNVFERLKNHFRDQLCPSDDIVKAEVQKWHREHHASFCQDSENLDVSYDKCLNNFGACVEK
jgi:hypothetical protein